MGKVEVQADKQAGFTLVELAVVMIIIGLLIGGVLKGQELIANAQIASTVTQVKGIDAATSTFVDTYNAFPGDMATAETRLAGCDGTSCVNGDGNTVLEFAPNTDDANSGESLMFWTHLALADLVTGVNAPEDAGDDGLFGFQLPTAPIGGGLVAGYSASGDIAERTAAANARGGHYVVLRRDGGTQATGGDAGAGVAPTTQMAPLQAARVDRKMDDGSPNTGTVVAIGGVAGDECVDAATTAGVYNEQQQGDLCALAIRIQQ